MPLFFTSDEHLWHENIMKFCHRPYSSKEEMVEALLQNHNAKVGPDDEVWHLGDMFWRTMPYDLAYSYMERLHGRHHYVWGNHEEFLDANPHIRSFFRSMQDRKVLKVEGYPHIVLDHFAGRVWHRSHQGAWQLYGHSHGELEYRPDLLSMEVGVDVCNYAPISIEEVAEKMRKKADLRLRQYDLAKANELHRQFEYSLTPVVK